ncbi:MAG TPA: TauD/TfdA family dioxygenase [Steroidobacteraceae bacterium]|nr:TauD/TfdA family dioxygenase [Steroidobacteraceae bacterium]
MQVSSTPECLTIEGEDGRLQFASLWLRDNAREDRESASGQRLIDVADLPERPRILRAALEGERVRIEWECESRPAYFELEWLAAHGPGRAARPELTVRRWLEGAALDAHRDFAWSGLAVLRAEPRARLEWLTRLWREGIAFMSGVPEREGAILDAMALVGFVLETNYGQVFDVRSVAQPENLAYSDRGLGLHTDNPYRDPVPGFQALHALVASAEGGASLFADGFAIAEHLRVTSPEDFARLTATAVPFHYRSRNVELYAERPLIQLSCAGEVAAVHYNNRSIAALRLTAAETEAYYRAYRQFAMLLREPRWQLSLTIPSGSLVVFDNQRILHGRTAFSSAREPRHLQGCYLTRDSVQSEAAMLRRALAEAHR